MTEAIDLIVALDDAETGPYLLAFEGMRAERLYFTAKGLDDLIASVDKLRALMTQPAPVLP